ncbi:hypothetical protein BG006_010361 [Podila minutissima]|uniref:Uncharacterized protein n=1 Tax=Podila minutissima TaxID=64525 RepID=A0A9P5VI99_9FUNG|nr:hypothetical protein BG006_010361 [Podila minutissima]
MPESSGPKTEQRLFILQCLDPDYSRQKKADKIHAIEELVIQRPILKYHLWHLFGQQVKRQEKRQQEIKVLKKLRQEHSAHPVVGTVSLTIVILHHY